MCSRTPSLSTACRRFFIAGRVLGARGEDDEHTKTPDDPETSEADSTQLDLARAQGDAYGRALSHMAEQVAHDGGVQPAGEYLIGYAVEEAEGMYEWHDGTLMWHDPGEANVHLEVAVCDASDGRFVPGPRVTATLIAPDGQQVGTHEQPMLWHPMIYHYGRNWTVPADWSYTLRVHIDPPTFIRHDEVNGRRFTEPVDVEFSGVSIERAQVTAPEATVLQVGTHCRADAGICTIQIHDRYAVPVAGR